MVVGRLCRGVLECWGHVMLVQFGAGGFCMERVSGRKGLGEDVMDTGLKQKWMGVGTMLAVVISWRRHWYTGTVCEVE